MGKNAELLICPDCGKKLELFRDLSLEVLYCSSCKIIFPTTSGIAIILAREARSYKTEFQLLAEIKRKLGEVYSPIHEYLDNTLHLVEAQKGVKSWEWEDEQHWGTAYAAKRRSTIEKNWNDRLWEREFLIRNLLRALNIGGKTIVDIGSGEGQTFRRLVAGSCTPDTLYVATDISLEGLQLNHERNPHDNSLFILCSEDHEIPLTSGIANVLFYWGILHHTKNKERNLGKDLRLLREGYVLLHEPVERVFLRSTRKLLPTPDESQHEDLLSKEKLLSAFTGQEGLRIEELRSGGSMMFNVLLTIFRNAFLANKRLFLFILELDRFLSTTVGRFHPFFSAGYLLVFAEKKPRNRTGDTDPAETLLSKYLAAT